jgi:hypothetical protein
MILGLVSVFLLNHHKHNHRQGQEICLASILEF